MIGKDYTQGNIWRNITDFALPYMLAYFLQMLYGLTDLFVIGRYCDVSSITAVSIGAQVMHLVTVVIIGLAMGTTVLTARAVGSHDTTRAASVIGNTVTLFALLAVLTTGALLWGRNAIVGFDGHPTRGRRRHGPVPHGVLRGYPFHHGIQCHSLYLPGIGRLHTAYVLCGRGLRG